jgi:hypothetical protein
LKATGTFSKPVSAETASASSFDAGPAITFIMIPLSFRMQAQVLRLYDLLFLCLIASTKSRQGGVLLKNLFWVAFFVLRLFRLLVEV